MVDTTTTTTKSDQQSLQVPQHVIQQQKQQQGTGRHDNVIVAGTTVADDNNNNDVVVNNEKNTNNDSYYMLAENFFRVTLFGLVGYIYGLGLDHQQRKMSTITTTNPGTNNNNNMIQSQPPPLVPQSNKKLKKYPLHPPTKRTNYNLLRSINNNNYLPTNSSSGNRIMTSTVTNVPVVWAISFIVFFSIMETVRLASPATFFLDSYHNYNNNNNENNNSNQSRNNNSDDSTSSDTGDVSVSTTNLNELKRVGMITIMDTMIGGMFAGLVIRTTTQLGQNPLLSRRHFRYSIPHPSTSATSMWGLLNNNIIINNRPPTILWSMRAGMGLGLITGIFEATANVLTIYNNQQQQLPPSQQQ